MAIILKFKAVRAPGVFFRAARTREKAFWWRGAPRCMTTKVFMALGFWTASSLVLYAAATLLHGALGTPSLRGGVPRFVVDDDRFVRDGTPFVLRSGSLHYARVPRAYWRDRLLRLRALGLNCVTTYVPWNFHETDEGAFDFDGPQTDVGAFVDEAKAAGLLVILRAGPYMCGEWEFGGFPAWLLAKDGLRLRTENDAYLRYVDRYWRALLPRFRRRLYSSGGNVVMVQLENEFGDYGDCASNAADAAYMRHLYDVASDLLGGPDAVIYSTVSPARNLDKASPFKNDSRVVATIDGPLADDYAADFAAQAAFNAPGKAPKMWTELWTGWYTHWGDAAAANKTADEYGSGVAHMALDENASFSLYMAHGGTSFGFMAGANVLSPERPYAPDVTSYDYNAPIGEAGDHTIGADGGDTFAAIRGAIARVYGAPPDEPPPIPKAAYGAVDLAEAAGLLENARALASRSVRLPAAADWPSMEALGQNYGFLLYAWPTGPLPPRLALEGLRDRAQAFVDGAPVGRALFRDDCEASGDCSLALPAERGALQVLVEAMGRINYGAPGDLADRKGLLRRPLAGDATAACLPLLASNVTSLPFRPRGEGPTTPPGSPVFLRGTLSVAGAPRDTYLDTEGLSKGLAWVNGANLGRFWETEGPQHALYVPAPFLQEGANDVVVLDLEGHAPPSIQSRASQRWSPPARPA